IQVMEKKSDEKRLEDILVVREFLEVFPKAIEISLQIQESVRTNLKEKAPLLELR
ncbi:hypothetical protein Tco_0616977, partial [Tanacetum coccineum]